MRHLAIDARGYPVPRFVEWIDGKPDFRVMDADYLRRAVRMKLCWLCGEPLGKFSTFCIGPMCAVNRTSAEPPCHSDCATFAAMVYPFLTLPKAERREANLPKDGIAPAGIMLKRNPGVVLLWTTSSYKIFQHGNGILFEIGPPTQVHWYARGRPATRDEVMESINSGLPILAEMAAAEGSRAVAQLQKQLEAALQHVPVSA
jgi:hypothetical protein